MQARATSKANQQPGRQGPQSKLLPKTHTTASLSFPVRYAQQKSTSSCPLFPTTTIGSFPQTKEIRMQRNKFTKGEITAEEYEKFIEKEIRDVIDPGGA